MGKTKTIYLRTLILSLLWIFVVSAFGTEIEINGIKYSLSTDKQEAEVISKYPGYSGKIVIPEEVEYGGTFYSVTSIDDDAFSYDSGLTSVTIPNSVTSIGDYTFAGCSGLTSITIPNSVTSIGSSAFEFCYKLISINIPNSVTSIGNKAFRYCSGLTSITIGNRVTSIGDYAFEYCYKLISINIPSSVTSIGNNALLCSSHELSTDPSEELCALSSLSVEEGNTKYDSRGNCNAIIETATNTLIRGTKNTIIPNSVTSIGVHAFDGCSRLTSVTIPNSVTSIGSSAFFGCSGLTSVTIPKSVTSIGSDAFEGCGLSSLSVEAGNSKYDSRGNCNAIIETETNTLICGANYTTIPNSVTSIGSCAFSGCIGLTSITIPNSVTSIGSSAFLYCIFLTSVTIPSSVTSIGSGAFLFSGLTSVTIPSSVTSIGSSAFLGNSLTSVTAEAKTPIELSGDIVLRGRTLYVPAGSRTAYIAADYWKNFKDIQELSPKMINNPTIGLSETNYTYDRTAIEPTVTVKDGETVISADEYNVSYANNINAGIATVTITDITNGLYTISGSTTFTINAKTVTDPTVTLSESSCIYDGTAKEPTVTVKDGETIIPVDEYTVSYSDNTNAGTATVTITDKEGGNYIVSGSTTFTINAKTVSNPTIILSEDTYTYDETAKEPTVTVKDGETIIPADEYIVSYINNTNAGTATITITDKEGGNYTISGSTTFTINTKTVSDPTVTFNESSCIYDGTAKEPTLTVKDGETIIPAEEYTVSYSDNTNAGTATVTITDKEEGNYIVSGSTTFTIAPKTISAPTISLSLSSYTYDGNAKEPTVIVKDGETIVPADEYTVSYSDNTNAGTATVTITDKEGGNYNVSGSTTFIINSKTVSVPTISLSQTIYFFDGNDKIPTVRVNDGETVIPASEYTVSYYNNTNAGTATVIIIDNEGGNYFVGGSTSFTIYAKTVNNPTIILSTTSYICDGTAKEPTVTVMDDETVIPASEYTISYSNNTNVGTATVTITDKEGGNYIVSGSTTFTIHGMELPADELFSGSNLWAGYVAQEDLRPGTGLKVYAITKLGTTTATASQIDYMPQGVPVLLKRANTTVSSYEVTSGTGTAPTTNLLRVFNADRNVSNREGFILFNDEFVLVNEGVLPAGRVFLPANNLQLSRGMTRTIVIDDDDATGIEGNWSAADDADEQWFDLQGRRLEQKPTRKGIYILNGRKVVVK